MLTGTGHRYFCIVSRRLNERLSLLGLIRQDDL